MAGHLFEGGVINRTKGQAVIALYLEIQMRERAATDP
jgi:hypothetical protein